MENARIKSEADRLFHRKDFVKAATLYEDLAERGDPSAKSALAFLYEHGQGVPRDLDKAERLYRAALKSGFSTAGLYLAKLLSRSSREQEAFLILDELAHNGHLSHIAELAHYWEKGIGCEADRSKAEYYYCYAANNGDLFSKRWLQLNRIAKHETYFDIFAGLFWYIYFSVLIWFRRVWG